jgi:AraC family transcriptional regulator
MASKYGESLTPTGWPAWPLRVGRFDSEGTLEGLVAADDAVLVWSGGRSDVTLEGRCGRRIDRHRFVRHAGMIDIMPRGTVLDRVRWQGQPSECVSVAFGAADVQRLLGVDTAFAPDAMRTAIADAHVVDLVGRLREQIASGQPWGSLYVEALALTLATYVYGRYGVRTPERSGEQSLSSAQSERISEFVEEHLSDPLSLLGMATLVGYSPDHFARLFKGSFGRSPYQYVLERRVERAKILLRASGCSITEVALLCGFASQAHMHAAFKARTGVTPGAYRKG